jgi:PPP family 3-phenylpropionic acid transporter
VTSKRQLFPFAMLSASYFAHIGFFNPYLPLWLKDMGFSLIAISVLTSVQEDDRAAQRAPLARAAAGLAPRC